MLLGEGAVLLKVMLTVFQNELDSSGFTSLKEQHCELREFSSKDVQAFIDDERRRLSQGESSDDDR